MEAGALEQRLDLGEAGVEVHAGERRLAVGDQAVHLQFVHCLADVVEFHPVHAALQLFDVQHLSVLSVSVTEHSSKAELAVRIYS